MTYKLEVGVFDEDRKFIPFVSEVLDENEVHKRMNILVSGYWKEVYLKTWIHKEDNPKTFVMGRFKGHEAKYGYRVHEITEVNA